MRFKSAIRWSKTGTLILILHSILEIIIILINFDGISYYLNLFSQILQLVGFCCLYVFFDTLHEKNNTMNQ